MGAGDSKVDFGQLQIEHYRKPGLNDQEIYQLYQIFQGLGPNKEGMVKASKVKQQYQESMNKKDFDLQIGNLEHLNWDTFFHIMSNDIIEKKQRFGDVQFDTSANDVGCVFCPYTVDKRQQ
ncbi:hypothetical protein TTHERM_00561300 (macronuclear) [Tetrahymena thermophila SB210]|uniref:Uncharacterized protein n=1 Tax=Tetrahymena thermophila (strain SB210) TaxID=312017 RepID=I7MDN4_TETTS|nr:hypothetical protein TTHERM_00561300 [Tetrahymena thermophila SB210]EAR89939.1 hypothetical protein TTHERM_00561300 [Tetrahymena thermophila SB210]|eukprot:XP_001010184.1 hypothetical protein TTHERM_00561300 [Tetrahymena thermophila SB210]